MEYSEGQHLWYPTQDQGFKTVCEIPEVVALAWAAIYYEHGYESGSYFANKQAIVVDVESRQLGTLAVYKHDDHYYLINKPW